MFILSIRGLTQSVLLKLSDEHKSQLIDDIIPTRCVITR